MQVFAYEALRKYIHQTNKNSLQQILNQGVVSISVDFRYKFFIQSFVVNEMNIYIYIIDLFGIFCNGEQRQCQKPLCWIVSSNLQSSEYIFLYPTTEAVWSNLQEKF